MRPYRLKVPVKGAFVLDACRCCPVCLDCGRTLADVEIVGHVHGCKYTKKGAARAST